MNNLNETILHVDLKKLEQNFNYLKAKLKTSSKIIGVVKAFAYGHGDIKVSEKLSQLGVFALWVSDFEEGVAIRESGIQTKIMVANPGMKSYHAIIKNQLDVVIYNHALLELYCSNKHDVNIHIKFNTGMNRYGFEMKDIQPIVTKIKNSPHLNLISICSHLAASDDMSQAAYTLSQIRKFDLISQKFELAIGKTVDKHLLNSSGVLNFAKYQLDGVRLGIGLYGSTEDENLQQISCLCSVITQIRDVEKNDAIGYNRSFVAKKNMKIAIVPVGYADGINRRLSNQNGTVFIGGSKCSIVGDISMDSFAVDVSKINAKEGDRVQLFGDKLTVIEIAKKINTIPYEIYATLNRRIKRVYSE